MVRKITVGLTTYCQEASFGSWQSVEACVIHRSYQAVIEKAGARAILLGPPTNQKSLKEAICHDLSLIDALVLSGGSDIDPVFYNQERNPKTEKSYPERDLYEIELAKAAYLMNMPTLAICRGNQVINVALGGSLFQDIKDIDHPYLHSNDDGDFIKNEIQIINDGILRSLIGEKVSGSCRHHQAISELSSALNAVGFSASGKIIEAVEAPDRNFFIGVQWHPEQDADLRLFSALVNSAK
jgi:putative glutamine amidotransferase